MQQNFFYPFKKEEEKKGQEYFLILNYFQTYIKSKSENFRLKRTVNRKHCSKCLNIQLFRRKKEFQNTFKVENVIKFRNIFENAYLFRKILI